MTTQPITGQAAPAPSYVSPIPISRTHLGHALASEWTKIRSVRSTMWTLGVFLALVILLGCMMAGLIGADTYLNTPYTMPAFFGLLLGQMCLVSLGVLVVSSEYGTGMIRTTFTASPQRHRVLAAKILVFFAVAFVTAAVAIAAVGLYAQITVGARTNANWLPTVFTGALYVSLMGVLALAVGSMMRHSAGAITTMLGVLLVPAILPAFLLFNDGLADVAQVMSDYNAINALSLIFEGDRSTGTGGAQIALLATLTVLACAGAFAVQANRDV
ncbi:ABC transporter permease subunit [Streptomyces sp. UH6]|uniref:ABC transporter permease subunit n=1 Tax=Streptomyces sp. UH6 TaxID=2748379 RepID=UPI0015D52328|nr:ABC transporter permease subunit [Streptomyces sp. UH6]NYV74663.1 ABC transporter permease [Streptomyces sp. UH6]